MYKFNVGDRVIVVSNNCYIPQGTLGTIETARIRSEYAHFISFDNGMCLWVHADGTWLTVKVVPYGEEGVGPLTVDWWETPVGVAWLRANMKEAPVELQPRYPVGAIFHSDITDGIYVLTRDYTEEEVFVYKVTCTRTGATVIPHLAGNEYGVVATHPA